MTETRSKPTKPQPESAAVKSFDPNRQRQDDVSGSSPIGTSRIRKTARTLWQAGLGAALTVESRASDVFHRLAKKGARYQSLRRRQTGQQPVATDEADNTEFQSRSIRESASERIHHFEHSLEASLDRGRDNTLHWIGVPSRKDFEQLENQVEALTHLVAAMQRQLDDSASASMGSERTRARH